VDLQVGRTAVVATVPAAEDLLDHVPALFGPAAGAAVLPHVTVLYPWLAPSAVTAADLDGLRQLAAEVPAFDVVFDRFCWFPGVLWLAPDPAEPFVRLTASAARRWPHTPPYGGAHTEITPHLTVMDLDGAGIDVDDEIALKDAVERLEPWLPVVHRVTELSVVLFEGDGAWTTIARSPLA
jgi:2'-5' RNA ligase superfamily